MKHLAKTHEDLYIYSMGKRFRVTGIFTDDASANSHMKRNSNDAVIACFGPFIVMAEKYTGERAA